jgi:hypothetical protein
MRVLADVEQPFRTAHDPEAHVAVVELHLDRADPPRAVAGQRHNRLIDTRLEASPESGGSAGASCSIYAHLATPSAISSPEHYDVRSTRWCESSPQ